ncbi:hypothetical protein MAPG_07692 [Magnaporthiopsis poae ATCC 64411]|uniref:Uncharacterized protein n=1 Tax=Magnaporthiopsis poae (strain ATCC 64411 / 73-15) TaxID=644358 RepID=A0A0C4E5C6_MAGP6|nr:hypothetical protein MAPG_07692 [Magnaporthiopsis poae ATCC 64411]
MDIHRCRFVPFPTSSINSLAFNRSYVSAGDKSQKQIPIRLAVGRENGDVEIWDPLEGAWHQEVIIHGGMGRKIDALVWATERDEPLADGGVMFGSSRLFSIGGGPTITEWDLAKGKARKHASGQHGDIWCLGLQPAAQGQNPSRLVAGTGDGCLALYSIEDDDLRLQRILVKSPSKKIHFVSIAFQSRHIVAIGCSDASIRVYDIRNGSVVRKMTLGRDLAGGSKDVIVWCVKTLPNGDIVSGDSTGQVCIWDGKTYTQAQRIQSHSQDVLSLAVSANGSVIVSGGMDKKTVLYKRMASQNGRWAKVFHRRYHAHDVKAMAAFEGRGMSVVVSGGSDACPVIIPLREAGLENHRTLPHLPQAVPVASAPEARIVVSWWGREVQVWRLPERTPDPVGLDSELEGPRPPKVLKRMLIKGNSDITSASISSNGSLLVISTTAELKLFQLDLESSISAREELRVARISLPENVGNLGASLSRVSPDGKWICLVREGSELVVLKTAIEPSTGHFCVHPGSSRQRLKRLHRETAQAASLSWINTYSRRISHISFAPDSRMLATADLAGYVDTWLVRDGVGGHDVEGGDDALIDSPPSHDSSTDDSSDDEDTARVPGGAWIRNPKASLIPKLPSAATVLSFSSAAIPEDPAAQDITECAYELLAVTSTSRLLLFDVVGGTLAPWSRRNKYIQLPEAFRSSRDLIKGALWQGSRVWLYGLSSIFMIDLSRDLPNENGQGQGPRRPKQGTKRKRDNNSTGAGSRMETGSLDSLRVQKVVPADNGRPEWVELEMDDADEARQDVLEHNEDDESDGGELQAMRAGRVAEEDEAKEKTGGAGWWHSFKYRPILGAVPLESSAAASTPGAAHLEMALVERPLWDVLPPRYVADNERDDRVSRDYP